MWENILDLTPQKEKIVGKGNSVSWTREMQYSNISLPVKWGQLHSNLVFMTALVLDSVARHDSSSSTSTVWSLYLNVFFFFFFAVHVWTQRLVSTTLHQIIQVG